jgi:hypothetical protein
MNGITGERRTWLVLGGLILVGVVFALGGPSISGAFPLLLLILICPLMMFFMMRSMGHDMQSDHQMAHNLALPPSTAVGSTPDEQLSVLQAQLADAQAQQERLAHEIEALKSEAARADPTMTPTRSA